MRGTLRIGTETCDNATNRRADLLTVQDWVNVSRQTNGVYSRKNSGTETKYFPQIFIEIDKICEILHL